MQYKTIRRVDKNTPFFMELNQFQGRCGEIRGGIATGEGEGTGSLTIRQISAVCLI